jgi:hypothetical protein
MWRRQRLSGAPPPNGSRRKPCWPPRAIPRPPRWPSISKVLARLWLDRVYLIGDDAVEGIWRPDVVEALKPSSRA